MQQIAPKLGDKVTVKAFLARRSEYKQSGCGQDLIMKVWDRTELSKPYHGIYVGKRNKSNGKTCFEYDEGYTYSAIAFFEVWMVAYADNRDILVCLPSDVAIDKEDRFVGTDTLD